MMSKLATRARSLKVLIAVVFLCGAIWTVVKPMLQSNRAQSGSNAAAVSADQLPSVGAPVSFVDGTLVFDGVGGAVVGEAGSWTTGSVVSVEEKNGNYWLEVALDEPIAGLRSVWSSADSVAARR